MTDIDIIVLEAVNALYNPVLNRQLNQQANTKPDNVGKYINYGSLAAALYHVYSAIKKNKDDKIGAALNAIPGAAMKAFAVALSGHAIKDLARGNYQPPGSHIADKSTSYFDNMVKSPNQSYLNDFQKQQIKK